AIEAAGFGYDTIEVTGALEIPAAILFASQSSRHSYLGYVALGCVIRGETTHYETVCAESARGLMALSLQGLAIGNGILTVENEEQAWARADINRKNKGGEAAVAAITMARIKSEFT
ncbi:MAG: 6,7-dimethyl-8-ribityllumazine synthase, partial [Pseudomonadota bacterium]|nr:6,7-dimethyl-8-ribityllumazine synthase [Pseudomonadota bacterium]